VLWQLAAFVRRDEFCPDALRYPERRMTFLRGEHGLALRL
jgi:hypothetical protein